MATIVTPRFLASAPSSSLFCPITRNYASLIPSNFLAISTKPTSEVRFSENLSTGTRMSLLARASPASTSAVVSDGIADVLGEVSIFTAIGEPVKFKELWDQKEGIAVVALLRHFGCFCCWELASALKESKERFDSDGVKLIAVGVGTPDKARLLAERLPFLWITFMPTRTIRHMMFWACIMAFAERFSTQPAPKYFQELRH